MYVIAMMCMLRIYQNRHPDIHASAYTTFGALAAVIFIGMTGVLAGTPLFWSLFTAAHIFTCLLLSAQVLYHSHIFFCLNFYPVFCFCFVNVESYYLLAYYFFMNI
jgi:heme A synthase